MTHAAARTWRFETVPLDHERLRRFSALVNDPNPVHVDPAFARGLGLPDAIAQGGLVVSAVSYMLDAEGIDRLDVKLIAPVPAGSRLVCEGVAVGDSDVLGEPGTVVECVVSDGSTVFARATVVVRGQGAS